MSTTAKLVVVLLGILIVTMVTLVTLAMGYISRHPSAETTVQPAPPPPAAGDAALARIHTRGELRVGMDTGNPPWIGSPPMFFLNEGQPDGFDYQLALRVAAAAGVPGKVKVVHHFYSDFEAEIGRAHV